MHKAPTKQKGDIGLTQVIANLELNKIKSAIPLAEHLPFDIIAISESAKLAKVSIKFRAMVNGCISVPLQTVHSNTKGSKTVNVNLDEVDAFAVYCPTNQKCYYIHSSTLRDYKTAMTLRVEPPKKNYGTCNNASDFESPQIIFGR